MSEKRDQEANQREERNTFLKGTTLSFVPEKRSVTADTALRLGRYFHMSPQFWLGLQMDYDLDVTADALANRLHREVKPHALAA